MDEDLDNNTDYLWHIERQHRIMERHGDVRRDRAIALSIGGVPIILNTRFDGFRPMILGDPIKLPVHLIEPVRLLRSLQQIWLDKLGKQPWRLTHVREACVAIERQIRNLAPRAEICRAATYTLKRIVHEIGHAARTIAMDPRSSAALAADDAMAEADGKIRGLIAAKGCRVAA